jgi:hypothetical protein
MTETKDGQTMSDVLWQRRNVVVDSVDILQICHQEKKKT